jgi:hypothetical protein
MEKEFAPYEQALDLKELGFDEKCFSFYDSDGKLYESEGYYKKGYNVLDEEVIAPLYQQAFRWFREKYGYLPNIHDFNGNFKATLSGNCNWLGSWTKTYEEAELACLKKLIEIVKNK